MDRFITKEISPQVTITDRLIAVTVLKFLPPIVTPNSITAFRFVTIPFIIYLLVTNHFAWGMTFFIISAFSDAVDGALARTKGLITDWGKMYDPLADKLLIGSVAVIVVSEFVGQWLALAIIVLELLIIIGAFWRKRFRGVEIQAGWAGKIKMVFQSVGLGLLLLGAVLSSPLLMAVGTYALYASLLFSMLSIFVYKSI
ncbi:MAG: hypothetical protein A2W52_02930 [Candidatus Taylorbacteria bacterium RIFCSPHIGHO2_02_49_25]|uniref:CDP-diacylglycerol--glycerol-3-phosphate 3-phosphatidyltransferase n=1 Tax=Candidatus Taylorbacteria bacterium RIFCSPHIGHO2_02_49_25 TaxID=1802305 RepID=A0A1G2MFT0_9BACT|nr:MAG: CDP-diacylglycerol-glycerol-3-phosphate 3-phosphatidyltransferase [Parcubacteria group bacterium GW2011_GWF2_50_9]OHA19107.1 MAG: hypothetical protein A2759_00845 [Candidatus Taylorbacteria bacterium RIFCSPHIGHO2_01_FULL_49_60]OHA22756.1 MAG: hypothetical protein A2W52_02930 [Candidatus Taylorbacteria bacterium RIFCSPHIGHO2_02_49_25]OHA35527.1 MAG: hypothetical protein A2W65_00505 [Candidatus Taylorbacteria bacterium RIFCSPLOWO2_02_50_13]OHA43022.1 MAG: hypothetical protein A3H73_03235 